MEMRNTHLDKYQILEKLASGGMADIFLAKSKNSQTPSQLLVIKKVLELTTKAADFIVGLKDEAKALSRLRHSNIVAFKDFVQETDQCYIVMEYVQGRSLQQLVQQSRIHNVKIELEHILHIVAEIACGLDYVHNSYDQVFQKFLNLVHRDINPQNIMISNLGEVKIIDFGISKFDSREEHTNPGLVKGKISYLSPEQIAHRPVDARTDIYALGVVLWELLAGRKLFDGKSNSEKINQIKNSEIPSLSEVNPEIPLALNQIVMKALAYEPDNRYQRALDFKYEILYYMAKNFPQYNTKTFKSLVKTFEALPMNKLNTDETVTENLNSPVGLYETKIKEEVKFDATSIKKQMAASNLQRLSEVSTNKMRSKTVKRKKSIQRRPQKSLFDDFLNAFGMVVIAGLMTYSVLFYYKAGHLKYVVSIVKQLLNLV